MKEDEKCSMASNLVLLDTHKHLNHRSIIPDQEHCQILKEQSKDNMKNTSFWQGEHFIENESLLRILH